MYPAQKSGDAWVRIASRFELINVLIAMDFYLHCLQLSTKLLQSRKLEEAEVCRQGNHQARER
jgi:hypothetical protein